MAWVLWWRASCCSQYDKSEAGNRFPRQVNMFQGTTIEELIKSVRRAEEHARAEQKQVAAAGEPWQQQVQLHELIEVG
jgi:hypothetical protein